MSQRRAVIAIILLLPIAAATYGRDSAKDLADERPLWSTHVAFDETAEWQEATWGLGSLVDVDPSLVPREEWEDPIELLPGTKVVEATIGFRPTSAEFGERGVGCEISIRDDDGRSWSSASLVPGDLAVDETDTCAVFDEDAEPIRTDQDYTLRHRFLVPTSTSIDDLSVVVRLAQGSFDELVFAGR